MVVTVPAGKKPGDTFQVKWPAAVEQAPPVSVTARCMKVAARTAAGPRHVCKKIASGLQALSATVQIVVASALVALGVWLCFTEDLMALKVGAARPANLRRLAPHLRPP